MKQVLLIYLVVCMSLPVFSQGAGGHVTRPKKKSQTTQSVKKPQKSQNRSKLMQTPTAAFSTYGSQIETITVDGISFNMVIVEGGTFMMGSEESDTESDEKPVHQVTLSSYMIGETEVTQELWQAVMGNNPSIKKEAKRPVEGINWNECQNFIRKLNLLTERHFRLPTEAEWEYAARGGKYSRGFRYSGGDYIDKVAWYLDNSLIGTNSVGQKHPNELGLYDMSGNVREWCQDWYEEKYSTSPLTNPTGPSSGADRVARGGCWLSTAICCRSSFREHYPPSSRVRLGLRLAL